MELADLRKQGIAPLPKPPPGVGLLPTPGPGSPPDGGKKIPSLFEIKVQPTVDLAQKIALRYLWHLHPEILVEIGLFTSDITIMNSGFPSTFLQVKRL